MSTAISIRCPIVHIDGNENDHFLFEHAARRTQTPFEIQHLFSGHEVIAYLKHEPPFNDQAAYPPPVFILCDCSSTSAEHDLVAAIRALGPPGSLPIIIFSGLLEPCCIANCYAAGADYFLRKPFDPARMAVVAETLYACAMTIPRSFDALVRLDEYQPRRFTPQPASCAPQSAPSSPQGN